MGALDFEQQFENAKKHVEDKFKEYFPIKGKKQTLVLRKIWIEDNISTNNFESQKKAVLNKRTWGVPVYVSLALKNNDSGKMVDEERKLKLFSLPKITPRGSFIVDGNEYQVTNQLRLKPGIYPIMQTNGEIRTHINVKIGRAFISIKLNISKKGRFQIELKTTETIGLYNVLSALGVSDNQMKTAWGEELLEVNKKLANDKDVTIFATKLTRRPFKNDEEAIEAIKGYLESTSLDKSATKLTVGKEFTQLDAQALLQSSKKLLLVTRGEEPPVDRDSLIYKDIMTNDDRLAERIIENRKKIVSRIRSKIDLRDTVREIVDTSFFNKTIVAAHFVDSDLSSTTEQTNPLHMYGASYRATITGEKGVGSEHAITDEMRSLNVSHYGFLDPVQTPESSRIGAQLNLAIGAQKEGTTLKTLVLNKKLKQVSLRADEVNDSIIAFPDQYEVVGGKIKFKSKQIMAIDHGVIKKVPSSKVQYFFPSAHNVFSMSTNMIPFLHHNQGNRALMASKHQEQAISLENPEEPLVQSKVRFKDTTFEKFVGESLAIKSPIQGKIHSIQEGSMSIKDEKGALHKVPFYKNFPLNYHNFFDHKLYAKKGDEVRKGQLLGDLNYTKNGTLALGTNLNVAYMPYKGYTYEDGIVISERASKKLTSSHVYKKSIARDKNIKIGKKGVVAYFPGSITSENYDKLDEDGVIPKGSKIKKGDVVIAAVQKKELTAEDEILKRFSKGLVLPVRKVFETWDYDSDGVVVDVVKGRSSIDVYIKTSEVTQIGDKLCGRHGNKGIVTKIIPDEEMPRTSDGKPIDIFMNPQTIIGRINVGQVLESIGGKIAEKTGKIFKVENFNTDKKYPKLLKEELKKNNLTDTENIIDPVTGKSLGKVLVGKQYILKMFKQAESGLSARSTKGYSVDNAPIKAGDEKSRRLDLLTMYAMLAHGAKANLREMSTYKAEKNEELWNAIKFGMPLPAPKPTFAYRKFEAYLKGAGINVKKEGNELVAMPMTTREIEELSSGEIKNPQFVRAKDLAEIKGGLFDPRLTGGLKGEKWTHMTLDESIPNPLFETPIRKLLNITEKQFKSIISGKTHVNASGQLNTTGDGKTGGKGFKLLLSRINISKMTDELNTQAKTASGDKLNDINKRLRYLKVLRENNFKPEEIYMQNKLPILPPVFRPIYPLNDGSLKSSDVNFLYRDVGLLNNLMAELKGKGLDETTVGETRLNLYNGVSAAIGLSDPINPYNQRKKLKGLIREISGLKSPKEGFYQDKLLGKEQDVVGRGTIIPDPYIGVDEVGLPEEMAWKMFENFIIRDLIKQGQPPLEARQSVKDRTSLAKATLEAVMQERKVLLNRAPSLHKFNILAFKPMIVSGNAIRIPPLVCKGFNADFDGDQMTVHVPITDAAVKEAEGMLPSKNLYNPGTGNLMLFPDKENLLGLYQISAKSKGKPQPYSSIANIKRDLDASKTTYSQSIKFNGKVTTIGRALVNELLPEKMRNPKVVFNRETTTKILQKLAKNYPDQYGEILNNLRALGSRAAYQNGSTVTLDDLLDSLPGKGKIISFMDQGIATINKSRISQDKKDEKILGLMHKANDQLKTEAKKYYGKGTNNFYEMIQSGASGKSGQFHQMLVTPLIVKGTDGKDIPNPIPESYAEGIPITNYWTSLYGSRTGMIDKNLQTQKPGALSKSVMATAIKTVITIEDCLTREGLVFSIMDEDFLDRVLAEDVRYGGRLIAKRGDITTTALVGKLRQNKVKEAKARSPITCAAPDGICRKCYGLDEFGSLPSIGDNVGAKAGQALMEPVTQLTISSFHSGAVSGTGIQQTGFDKIDKLLKLPKIISGEAPLSELDGTVGKIEDSPLGGKNIYIGDKIYRTPTGAALLVRSKQKVKKGDPLSRGFIRADKLIDLKGPIEAEKQFVNDLIGTYRDQGIQIKKKIGETVVRSVGNLTQVTNPKDSEWIVGDYVPRTLVDAYNIGLPMSQQIDHRPTLKGLKTLPFVNKDWLSQLGFERLKETLKQAPAQGMRSHLHSYSPIPAYVYGAEFGEGEEEGTY